MEEKENAVKVHAIRFHYLWIVLGLLVWSNPAIGWIDPQPKPSPQTQANDDLNNKDLDDEDAENPGGDEQALADAGAAPEAPAPKKLAEPKKPAAPAPTAIDGGAAVPVKPTKPPPATPPVGTVKPPPAQPTPKVAPPARPTPLQMGTTKLGVYKPDTNYSQAAIVLELQTIWGIAGVLVLSLAVLLLHFLLPVGGLRFLGKTSHFLLGVGTFALAGVLLYRFFLLGNYPGTSLQTGLLWFAFVSLGSYMYQRRAFSNVYIGSGVLLMVATAALAWSAINAPFVPEQSSLAPYASTTWSLSSFAMYTAFGFLAVAGSWMVASWFLGILAKRERGTGYGLEPTTWEEYRLHPSFLVFLAYPLLTVSWVLQLVWSQAHYGNATMVWRSHPRLWSVLIVWLLLSAHLFALRAPTPKSEMDELRDEDAAVSKSYPKLPGFMLLLATVGGSVLFVGAHVFLAYLRSS